MYKVEQLYVVFDDGDGHRHLIPKEYYSAFEKNYERIEEAFSEHRDYEIFSGELDNLLDHFSNHRLEGESYYAVFDEHIIDEVLEAE